MVAVDSPRGTVITAVSPEKLAVARRSSGPGPPETLWVMSSKRSTTPPGPRSEESRVGKECRCGGLGHQWKRGRHRRRQGDARRARGRLVAAERGTGHSARDHE